jgi:hypothetical protein
MTVVFTFAHYPNFKACRLDREMIFSNEKNGMRVKPPLVSKEAAQRSGGLPTLITFG